MTATDTLLRTCWRLQLLLLLPSTGYALTIEGNLRTIDQEPVSGAMIVVSREDDPSWVVSTTTDERGRYQLQLGVITAVLGAPTAVPAQPGLEQNYPNPFNPTTVIPFDLSAAGPVRLDIYNVLGQPVRSLVDGILPAAHHEVVWDGLDARGHGVAAGVYIYRLQAPGVSRTRKMLLLDGAAGHTVAGKIAAQPAPREDVFTLRVDHDGLLFEQRSLQFAGDSIVDIVVGGGPLIPVLIVRGDLNIDDDAADRLPPGDGPYHVTGSVYIHLTDREDLRDLRHLRSVGDALRISASPQLLSLAGLEQLESVSSLTIDGCPKLKSLSSLVNLAHAPRIELTGLDALADLQGLGSIQDLFQIDLKDNPSLASLQGLEGLAFVGRDLTINDNSSLRSLAALRRVESVGRSLEIVASPVLRDLDGLQSVRQVGSLVVRNNAILSNLDSLEEVVTVGGRLAVSDNPRLVSIEGLRNLERVDGDLQLFKNALESLEGLRQLREVTDELQIVEDHITSLAGLRSLRRVGGDLFLFAGTEKVSRLEGLTIAHMPRLLNLASLSHIDSIGALQLTANDNLVSLAGLKEVVGPDVRFLSIFGNPQLTDLDGLQGIRWVSTQLSIRGNDRLHDLTALRGIRHVGSSLSIRDNAALQSLDGLESITTVGVDLTIRGNEQLTDLTGLGPFSQVRNLVIRDSPGLIDLAGLRHIVSVNGPVTIAANTNLQRLDGLEALETVALDLGIFANPALISLSALRGLTRVRRDLIVNDNPLLPEEEITDLVTRLGSGLRGQLRRDGGGG
ncbi:MAG: T9SS type A sorting domain-containing protein [Gemmatimonadetes bacterium]|jgi:hypothetical protein|nr:T9SS type A sorting domain-containing protein [Gemmatimonadota bacterium]MBT5146369.1 T9SS type A sorting domain-containing protein [Gemmatimonadota bacterium]MBT5591292.1 T9SS type A sorting domain-containing protein [Gemmatimonadota bacterium]MBT5962253.1 T9SS type A sorting domain-containing protein [Gemmatimonadota bacterium]MBT6628834.1 T9SS type A sorting domain-containing protein [Gemmatimonadota bacterium]